jgi:hypothetical protein
LPIINKNIKKYALYNISLTRFCIRMPENAIFSIYSHSLKARTQQFILRSRNLPGEILSHGPNVSKLDENQEGCFCL